MTDKTFAPLNEEDGVGWNGEVPLLFGGRQYAIPLLIQADENEGTDVTDVQRNAFARLMEKWNGIEPLLVEALIDYYNHEEKNSFGPDDEKEAALWWPEINTYEELVNAVTPETLVIPPDDWMEHGRRIYLLFGRTWGGEDLDDNGIGVCFVNEQIAEIGYKDIAF